MLTSCRIQAARPGRKDMHTLSCTSGGEDNVCLALTKLSKELMEENSDSLEAAGCDSSDCLFCQYRSHSPFHLNTYSGKLTSLLRKRSSNGVPLASYNSQHSSAMLSVAAAPMAVKGAKRPRTILSSDIASAAGTSTSKTQSPPPTAATTADSVTHTLIRFPQEHYPAFLKDTPHDCVSMCGGRLCSGHTQHFGQNLYQTAVLEATQAANTDAAAPAATLGVAPTDAILIIQPGRDAAGVTHIAGTQPIVPDVPVRAGSIGTLGLTVATLHAVPVAPAAASASPHPDQTPTWQPAADDSNDDALRHSAATSLQDGTDEYAAGPGPSSLLMQQLTASPRYPLRQCHLQKQLQQHQVEHLQPHPRAASQLLSESSLHLPGGPPTQQGKVATHQLQQPQHQGREQDARIVQQRQQPQEKEEVDEAGGNGQQRQQPQQRMVCGRPLPEGWAFRPEWRHRVSPAPAALKEVLRLVGTESYTRSGIHCRLDPCAGGSTACGRSTGIVCALEFSPDGRLLAAGGVDKQIRMYNLSSALGASNCADVQEEDEMPMGLDSGQFCCSSNEMEFGSETVGSRRNSGGGGDGRSASIRRGGARGDGEGDGIDDEEDEQYRSLLASVQRMPSKISSMAWSPFLDGVLTIGDYDGVLLQLHIASGHQLADVEAHSGRKIWSVAHSSRIPHLAGSAADDRFACLWAGRGLSRCIASLQPNPHASVCSVDFSPERDQLLALACSDRTAYLYDMRNLDRGPLAALQHHSRPASYCKFLGLDRVVTAATDGSLALWDISLACPLLRTVIMPPPSCNVQAPAADETLPPPFKVVQSYDRPLLPPPPPLSRLQRADEVMSMSAEVGLALSRPNHFSGGDAAASTEALADSNATVTAAAVVNKDRLVSCSVSTGSSRSCPAPTRGSAQPCRVFRGHRNEKNFVGLSVRSADGLLACGSECNRAFAYHTSWSNPLATMELSRSGGAAVTEMYGSPAAGHGAGIGFGFGSCMGGGFVSAVCWQPSEAAVHMGLPPLLASATSRGSVSISTLTARP